MSKQPPELDNSYRFRYFDWEKAKMFYYVAKVGSFTKAAELLNTFQPSLSRYISALERHLGCPLLMRTARGVKMTRKGEELFSIIESVFLDLKGFTNNSHVELDKGEKRKIRIATTHAITAYILDDLILKYNKDYPHLIFELISDDHLLDIIINDVDIAIRPYDPDAKGIQQDYLFTLEKKLYASTEYLEKYGEPKTVEELKGHHIIAPAHPEEYPYAELTWILKLGMPEGKLHQPAFSANSIESLVKAAKMGMGIIGSYEEMSILKEANLQNVLRDVKDKKVRWYFIYPEYLKKDKEIITLKDFLHKTLSSYKE